MHISITAFYLILQFLRIYSQDLAENENESEENAKKIICYYTNWSQYRPGEGKFSPSYIDPHMCTHILYSFAKLNENSEIVGYEWNDESTPYMKGYFEKVNNLKKDNPKLKVLLAVGGWNHGSGPFSVMVNNQKLRQRFIKSTVKYLLKHEFDGLDLDWEYPGSREGSKPSDKEGFSQLVIELKKAFEPFGLILSAAVSGAKDTIDKGYEIDIISEYLDFITVMAYDYHGSWENFTGHYSPLYPRKEEIGTEQLLNADWAINYWLNKGAPASKLVLGLGTYGRVFKLVDPNTNYLGAPAYPPKVKKPISGKYTREAGYLSYYEVCTYLSSGWTKKWNDEQLVPIAFKGNDWVGYDDMESIRFKANYAKSLNLTGISFWSLDLDDYNGNFCNQGKYPLIRTARNEFLDITELPAPAKSSKKSKGKSRNNAIKNGCKFGGGYFTDKKSNCRTFYICYSNNNDFEVVKQTCPEGSAFDLTTKTCNFAQLVNC